MVIRIVSFGLIGIILMVTTPLKELTKTPLLIKHFIEHTESNPELGILSFLSMHYLNDDPIDEDYEEDMKLPFKIIDFSSSVVFLIVPEYQKIQLEYTTLIKSNLTKPNYQNDFSISAALASIWQPPKIL